MYFSTNVMFRSLHSNSTIYLSTSTRQPSGGVRVHIVGLHALTVGVGRLTGKRNVVVYIIYFYRIVICMYSVFVTSHGLAV